MVTFIESNWNRIYAELRRVYLILKGGHLQTIPIK